MRFNRSAFCLVAGGQGLQEEVQRREDKVATAHALGSRTRMSIQHSTGLVVLRLAVLGFLFRQKPGDRMGV